MTSEEPVIDFTSQSWFAVRRFAERRLDEMRRKNDGALNIDQTNALRGSIATLKEILALERAPENEADEPEGPFA